MATLVGSLTFREVPGSTLKDNEYGVDELTRTFLGHRSYFEAFRRNLKGSRDSEFTRLICKDYTANFREGDLVEVQAVYKGLIDGLPPEPVIINETFLASIQLYYKKNGNSTPFTASYFAPRTTYRYTRTTRPLSAQYNTIQPTNFPIRPFNPTPRVVNLEAQRITKIVTSDFVSSFRTEKQGDVYECEETIERKLYDYTAVDF